MKDMGKLERNGVGSQREIVPKDLMQSWRKVPPFYTYMCHQAGDCNKYFFGIYWNMLYNFQWRWHRAWFAEEISNYVRYWHLRVNFSLPKTLCIHTYVSDSNRMVMAVIRAHHLMHRSESIISEEVPWRRLIKSLTNKILLTSLDLNRGRLGNEFYLKHLVDQRYHSHHRSSEIYLCLQQKYSVFSSIAFPQLLGPSKCSILFCNPVEATYSKGLLVSNQKLFALQFLPNFYFWITKTCKVFESLRFEILFMPPLAQHRGDNSGEAEKCWDDCCWRSLTCWSGYLIRKRRTLQ